MILEDAKSEIMQWMIGCGLGNFRLELNCLRVGFESYATPVATMSISIPINSIRNGEVTKDDRFLDIENDLLASDLFYRAKNGEAT